MNVGFYSVAHVQAQPAAGPAGTTCADPSLLPAPQEMPADPLMALFALQSKSQLLDVQSGIKDVQTNRKLREKAWKEMKAALAKARRARKKGGRWKTVAKLCSKLGKYGSVVAAIAIAVGTGGVGTPFALAIAGAALSSASLLQSETQFLQRMGMDDSMAAKFEFGLALGGAACTAGAGVAASASAAQQTSEAAAATDKMDKFVRTTQTVQRAAMATTGAATAVGGVASFQAKQYDADATDHETDALRQHIEDQRLLRLFSEILEQIEEAQESEQRTMASLRGAIDARDTTPLTIARRV